MTAFSIFMASSTQTVWPTSTVVPDRDHDLHDRALHRDHDGPGPVPVTDARFADRVER